MYNFPMPTETLRAELAEAREEIKTLKVDVAEARGIVFDLDEELSAAKAQIDAALRLHTPVLEGVQGDLPDGSYGYIEPACSTCGDADAHGVPWPCDTAKALGMVP
jgi:hypothetical protein